MGSFEFNSGYQRRSSIPDISGYSSVLYEVILQCIFRILKTMLSLDIEYHFHLRCNDFRSFAKNQKLAIPQYEKEKNKRTESIPHLKTVEREDLTKMDFNCKRFQRSEL
mmetsp:Transcript_2604/g.3930  ORF Transcript_2604/g.3930 Transcript_2604/m.3930 type:complete len:109 (-) Transcript_2604:91-417(-)